MNTNIILDSIQIIGFAILACAPLDQKRIRARWANSIFVICAIIGIAKGAVGLAWNMGLFMLGNENTRRLDGYLSMAGGLLLGFLFSLILSGQLMGTKRTNNELRT
ncbi:MAG TPA: hypothetical protein VHG71_09415 [Verrucomicrobiae bacterium]|nr:hypothetical protein [Verrucomicrobiae bacterium]